MLYDPITICTRWFFFSTGTFDDAGVVTAVALQCVARPASVQLAFLQCASYSHVLQTLTLVSWDACPGALPRLQFL